MFAALYEKLGSLFSPSHYDEREEYLASSYDLEDLERRMRHFDNGGYPFRLHSSVMPRDNELQTINGQGEPICVTINATALKPQHASSRPAYCRTDT